MAHEVGWRDLHPPGNVVAWLFLASAGFAALLIGIQALDANLESEVLGYAPSVWDSVLRYGAVVIGALLTAIGVVKVDKLIRKARWEGG